MHHIFPFAPSFFFLVCVDTEQVAEEAEDPFIALVWLRARSLVCDPGRSDSLASDASPSYARLFHVPHLDA